MICVDGSSLKTPFGDEVSNFIYKIANGDRAADHLCRWCYNEKRFSEIEKTVRDVLKL